MKQRYILRSAVLGAAAIMMGGVLVTPAATAAPSKSFTLSQVGYTTLKQTSFKIKQFEVYVRAPVKFVVPATGTPYVVPNGKVTFVKSTLGPGISVTNVKQTWNRKSGTAAKHLVLVTSFVVHAKASVPTPWGTVGPKNSATISITDMYWNDKSKYYDRHETNKSGSGAKLSFSWKKY